MSIFVRGGKNIRLGSQTFQPLGMWPVTNVSGGRGSSGASAQPEAVPMNVSGYYTKRVKETTVSPSGIDRTPPGSSTQAN